MHLKSLCNDTIIYMGTALIEIIKRVNNLIDNYYLVDGNISNAMIATNLYSFFKLNWVPDNMDVQFHLQIRRKCIVTLDSLISQETTLPEVDSRDQCSSDNNDNEYYSFKKRKVSLHCITDEIELELRKYFTSPTSKSLEEISNSKYLKKAFIKLNSIVCSTSPVVNLIKNKISYPVIFFQDTIIM